MRSDITRFAAIFDRPPAPGAIIQEPLDGDPAHYARLCALDIDVLPSARDFTDYAHDIAYMEAVQPDLFARLLPVCLHVWRYDLMHDHRSGYGGSVEIFNSALARRPLLGDCLTTAQSEAVMAFMRDSLLDRIDREDSLSHRGQYATAYAWFYRMGSFAVIFPDLESLWRAWWRFDTPGQAVAALQYLSCLMYEDTANPIFAPWTRKHGGGTPGLWETDGQTFDRSWQMENTLFLMETLTVDYVRDALQRAQAALAGVSDSDVPALMLGDYERCRPLLGHRLNVLPDLLSIRQSAAPLDWPPMS